MQRILFIALVLLVGCNLKTSDKINSEAVNREIEAREIKRVKEAEVVESAYQHGKRMAAYLNDSLSFTSGDCGTSLAELLPSYDTALLISAELLCNIPDNATAKERMVWEAYQHNFTQNAAMDDNIQKLGGDSLVYSYPLLFTADSTSATQWAVIQLLLSKREVIRRY